MSMSTTIHLNTNGERPVIIDQSVQRSTFSGHYGVFQITSGAGYDSEGICLFVSQDQVQEMIRHLQELNNKFEEIKTLEEINNA